MLGVHDEAALIAMWETLESKAVLPTDPEEFFDKSGPARNVEEREYERHYLRCQAILKYRAKSHAIYMKDCSRSGMGFLSPIQFLPREHVEVRIDSQRGYSLEVTRCRRLKTNCYSCGTIFVLRS